MKIQIVQLSDIHIKFKDDEILSKADAIASSIYNEIYDIEHLFIVVTGDVAFSGKSDEYNLAITFFEAIKNKINEEVSVNVSYIVVPGNHDCNFSKNTKSRDILIGSLGNNSPQIDSSVIDGCTAIQDEFFEFRDLIEDENGSGDKLWKTKKYTIGNSTISFECLNMAWMSKKIEEQGVICFPHECYEGMVKEDVDIRISLLHHPVNWLSQKSYRPLRKFLRNISNIVITGHEHVGCFGENDDSESNKSSYIEGCPLWTGDMEGSSFNSITIDLSESKYKAVEYIFEKRRNIYVPSEVEEWANYRDLSPNKKNGFVISDYFYELIDDVGGGFRHPAKQKINLSDIYIFPDVKLLSDEDKKEVINASIFQNIDNVKNGVVIEGREKSGGTNLIYRLYANYHDLGFVPLMLRGGALKKSEEKHVKDWISNAVIEQYGEDALFNFLQLESDKKILFIDDFDEIKIRGGFKFEVQF